ncbi:hypothetical protein COU57_00880 [Candidatus Pacearchaeota archaeon CG10_big_fil_rev_8_21_14_0_10_32_14]|nr:MAG: hypothetical protein COU57_00880 [Candidatus Pacearchaeota archaeon CG10_big_fil_rev_8_21_14_0_10_32_14]
MVQVFNKWDKIIGLLFLEGNVSLSVRDIAKKSKIPSSTAQRYLNELKKEGLIDKENRAIITPYYKFLKTFFIINKIHSTGLYDYLTKELNPSLIILYGSARKGEYNKQSDLDLFIESPVKKELKLSDYEKKIGLTIHLMIKDDLNKVNEDLIVNLYNGIKLYGSFKLKK